VRSIIPQFIEFIHAWPNNALMRKRSWQKWKYAEQQDRLAFFFGVIYGSLLFRLICYTLKKKGHAGLDLSVVRALV